MSKVNSVAVRAAQHARKLTGATVLCAAIVVPCPQHVGQALISAMACPEGAGCDRCAMPVCRCLAQATPAPDEGEG
jgi:hypothetical protein